MEDGNYKEKQLKKMKEVTEFNWNTFFHHSLKPNIKECLKMGGIKYKTCTNKYGFRENCSKENF